MIDSDRTKIIHYVFLYVRTDVLDLKHNLALKTYRIKRYRLCSVKLCAQIVYLLLELNSQLVHRIRGRLTQFLLELWHQNFAHVFYLALNIGKVRFLYV